MVELVLIAGALILGLAIGMRANPFRVAIRVLWWAAKTVAGIALQLIWLIVMLIVGGVVGMITAATRKEAGHEPQS